MGLEGFQAVIYEASLGIHKIIANDLWPERGPMAAKTAMDRITRGERCMPADLVDSLLKRNPLPLVAYVCETAGYRYERILTMRDANRAHLAKLDRVAEQLRLMLDEFEAIRRTA